MTNMLHLELVTPEKHYASEEVQMAVIPGEMGELGIMAHHASLISMIRPGLLRVHSAEGSVKRYFISGGYANVADNCCTILAESLIEFDTLQREEIESTLAGLRSKREQASTDTAASALDRTIAQEEAKLALLS